MPLPDETSPESAGADSAVDPAEIMQRVRERLSAECAAEDAAELEQLVLLQREMRELRAKLGEAGSSAPRLKDAAVDELGRAEELQDIPPQGPIIRIPPLLLLYKAWRKVLFASQRTFNLAVARLFRHAFHNFLLIEREELRLHERLDQLERRIEQLERERR